MRSIINRIRMSRIRMSRNNMMINNMMINKKKINKKINKQRLSNLHSYLKIISIILYPHNPPNSQMRL